MILTLSPILVQVDCSVKLFFNNQEKLFCLYKLVSNIVIYSFLKFLCQHSSPFSNCSSKYLDKFVYNLRILSQLLEFYYFCRLIVSPPKLSLYQNQRWWTCSFPVLVSYLKNFYYIGPKGRLQQLLHNYIYEDTYYMKKRKKEKNIYKERKKKKERNEIIRKA